MAYIGVSPSNGTRRVHTYTATASQTTFSGAGAEGATLSYKDSNFVDVYQNGVKLGDADYTATSGTSIVLGTGATVSDLVVIVVYDVFSVADTVSKADGGTFDGNVTMAGTLATTGNATFSGDIIKSTSGTSNFAAGVNAGNSIASGGNYNTVIGDEAGTALTTGDGNVAVGFEALKTEDGHGKNVAIGYQALKTLNAGGDGSNTAVGYQAGLSITTGSSLTLIGANAGDALTIGNNNTAVGDFALSSEIAGDKNVAIGGGTLQNQSNSSDADAHNTAVGYRSGNAITTGIQNTLLGGLAGDVLTDADYNVAIGLSALGGDTKGSKSVAIGVNSLAVQNFTSSTDSHNVAVGYKAGNAVTTGRYNTFIGSNAGDATDDGSENIAIGNDCLGANAGDGNTAMGSNALLNCTGSQNTAIGQIAGYHITSGTKNTIIGRYNGNQNNLDIRTSSNNIVLSDGDGNALYHIDSNAQHNPYRGSSSSNDNIISFRSNVNGTRNGNCNIQADGDIFNLGGTYGQQSDITLKENIVDANSQWDDIKALRIRNFSWKHNNLDAPNLIGVVAQEVETAGMNGLIKEQEDGTLAVKHSILFMKAVKALQEAMTKIETLESKVATLEGA